MSGPHNRTSTLTLGTSSADTRTPHFTGRIRPNLYEAAHFHTRHPQLQTLVAVCTWPWQFPSYAWHPPTRWQQTIRFSLLHRACCFDYFFNIPTHALIIYTLRSTKLTLKHLKTRFHPVRYSRYIHKRTVMTYGRILHKSITSVHQMISTW